MNDLHLRVTQVVANFPNGALSYVAQGCIKDGQEMSFLIIIHEMCEYHKERMVKILGEELYNEVMESM